MREHTFPDDKGWSRLGLVLWKMGESTMAQQIYGALLKQATKDSAKAPIYEALGLMMKRAQGEYAEALAYYKKSIEIKEKQIPRNNLSSTMSYNNIGNVYYSINDYTEKLFRSIRKISRSAKNHFFPLILVWLTHIITSDYYTKRWVIIQEHNRLSNVQ